MKQRHVVGHFKNKILISLMAIGLSSNAFAVIPCTDIVLNTTTFSSMMQDATNHLDTMVAKAQQMAQDVALQKAQSFMQEKVAAQQVIRAGGQTQRLQNADIREQSIADKDACVNTSIASAAQSSYCDAEGQVIGGVALFQKKHSNFGDTRGEVELANIKARDELVFKCTALLAVGVSCADASLILPSSVRGTGLDAVEQEAAAIAITLLTGSSASYKEGNIDSQRGKLVLLEEYRREILRGLPQISMTEVLSLYSQQGDTKISPMDQLDYYVTQRNSPSWAAEIANALAGKNAKCSRADFVRGQGLSNTTDDDYCNNNVLSTELDRRQTSMEAKELEILSLTLSSRHRTEILTAGLLSLEMDPVD